MLDFELARLGIEVSTIIRGRRRLKVEEDKCLIGVLQKSWLVPLAKIKKNIDAKSLKLFKDAGKAI